MEHQETPLLGDEFDDDALPSAPHVTPDPAPSDRVLVASGALAGALATIFLWAVYRYLNRQRGRRDR